MKISPVSDQSIPNLWDLKELPERPPMPKDSIWVKMLQKLYPEANPEKLCKDAGWMLCKDAGWMMDTMLRMVTRAIAREAKIHRETAQKWKDAIYGR